MAGTVGPSVLSTAPGRQGSYCDEANCEAAARRQGGMRGQAVGLWLAGAAAVSALRWWLKWWARAAAGVQRFQVPPSLLPPSAAAQQTHYDAPQAGIGPRVEQHPPRRLHGVLQAKRGPAPIHMAGLAKPVRAVQRASGRHRVKHGVIGEALVHVQGGRAQRALGGVSGGRHSWVNCAVHQRVAAWPGPPHTPPTCRQHCHSHASSSGSVGRG